ncbi:lectin family protein, partial [Toxoplasma gondii MAS]
MAQGTVSLPRSGISAVSAFTLASCLLLSPLALFFLSVTASQTPPAPQTNYEASYQASPPSPPSPHSPPSPPVGAESYVPPNEQGRYREAPPSSVQNLASSYQSGGRAGEAPYAPQTGDAQAHGGAYVSPPAAEEGAPLVPPVAAPGDSSAARRKERGQPLWQETVGSVELSRHSWAAPLDFEAIQ